jgi:hypothetical protein
MEVIKEAKRRYLYMLGGSRKKRRKKKKKLSRVVVCRYSYKNNCIRMVYLGSLHGSDVGDNCNE